MKAMTWVAARRWRRRHDRGTGIPASRTCRSAFCAGVLLLAGAATGLAAELRVDVTGLRAAKGAVHVAVYAVPERFPKSDGMMAEAVVEARLNGIQAVFSGLPAGAYALAAFHDENGNRKFDQGLFGIPLEGYGFSNGAKVFFGPPEFAEAVVRVPPDGARITIPIGY